jgi:hypothetical protein
MLLQHMLKSPVLGHSNDDVGVPRLLAAGDTSNCMMLVLLLLPWQDARAKHVLGTLLVSRQAAVQGPMTANTCSSTVLWFPPTLRV